MTSKQNETGTAHIKVKLRKTEMSLTTEQQRCQPKTKISSSCRLIQKQGTAVPPHTAPLLGRTVPRSGSSPVIGEVALSAGRVHSYLPALHGTTYSQVIRNQEQLFTIAVVGGERAVRSVKVELTQRRPCLQLVERIKASPPFLGFGLCVDFQT